VSTTPADGSRAIWADDDDPRICRDTEPALAGGPVNAPAPDWTRMWNYWLGGKDHYPADRQAAGQYTDLFPGAVTVARSCRYFTARVVSYLASQADIRDFPRHRHRMPFADPVDEVAQRAAPGDVVYVSYADNDSLVLAHARALLTGPPDTIGHIGRRPERPRGPAGHRPQPARRHPASRDLADDHPGPHRRPRRR